MCRDQSGEFACGYWGLKVKRITGRSFLGVAGKSPKMITYFYKVVCFFFSYKETFIPYLEIFYFAALNKLVYLME